jgi:hypothetical protein
MTKQPNLSTLVRELIEKMLAKGPVNTDDFAHTFTQEYPQFVEEHSFQLGLNAIKKAFRDLIKQTLPQEQGNLYEYFGESLPRALAVPRRGTDEPYYVATENATGAEADAALMLLDLNVTAVIARRDAVAKLIEVFRQRGGRDHDRLADVLRPKVDA